MKSEFCYLDGIKWELFEKLLPKLLYTEDRETYDSLMDHLKTEGQGFLYAVFDQMCEDDGVEHSFKMEEFDVKTFRRGKIDFVQMDLPPYNPQISDIVRTYILGSGQDGVSDRRYFIIKHFKDGETFILYVTPQLQVLKVEELTEHAEDMDYEYWRLAVDYLMILRDEQKEETEVQGDWSRDWLNLDWSAVRERIREGRKDIGLTEAEYLEFLRWSAENDPEIYEQTVMYLALKQKDAPDQ